MPGQGVLPAGHGRQAASAQLTAAGQLSLGPRGCLCRQGHDWSLAASRPRSHGRSSRRPSCHWRPEQGQGRRGLLGKLRAFGDARQHPAGRVTGALPSGR
jgi:hypothetical protein